jgi:hypothetical protein
MIAQEQLKQLINERTSELEKYALTPNAKDWYIQKENKLLASLTDIFNELDCLRHQNIWQRVESYWQYHKANSQDFNGIQLDIRYKPTGLLHYLPLNLYEYGI